MKKIILILLAATAVLAACNKSESPLKNSTRISFVASLDAPEGAVPSAAPSRTELVPGNNVHWIAGDQITIFDGETNECYTTTDDGASATFEADIENPGPWYALYPYNPNAVITGSGNITTTLPAVQRAKAGSFADELNISIAKTETSTLEFKNFPSYLKFQVPAANIKRVTIKGADNEPLAGKVQIKMSSSNVPIIQDIKSGANVVTLLPPAGNSTFATGVDYYIAVFPGTLEHGFWLLFTYNDNTIGVSSTTNSAPFARNTILNIGTPTLAQPTDVINFRDAVLISEYGSSFTVADAAATTSLSAAVKSGAVCLDDLVYFGLTGGLAGFASNTSLKSIILPSGITSMNSTSFSGCSSLECVVFNDGFTGIAKQALENNSSLNSLLIPSTLSSISGNAFTGAGNLDMYFLGSTPPATVTPSAFKSPSVYSFYIPAGSTSDYTTRFASCTGTINYIEY